MNHNFTRRQSESYEADNKVPQSTQTGLTRKRCGHPRRPPLPMDRLFPLRLWWLRLEWNAPPGLEDQKASSKVPFVLCELRWTDTFERGFVAVMEKGKKNLRPQCKRGRTVWLTPQVSVLSLGMSEGITCWYPRYHAASAFGVGSDGERGQTEER